MSDLVERLRGEYRIPITDGLGPAGGDEPDNPKEFVRHFDTPPIQHEAATEIERLRAALASAKECIGKGHLGMAATVVDCALKPNAGLVLIRDIQETAFPSVCSEEPADA